MRKKIVRWLQVNVFLNPFIPDLQQVFKPDSDVWVFTELRLEKVHLAL